MDKKIIFLAGICIFLLVSFSGCTQQENEMDPTIKRIQDAGVLKVGTSADYEPLEYLDENDNIVGYDIDIAAEIADELGVSLYVINMPFNMTDFTNALNNGEVDIVISAITITPERSEQVLFSNAYLNAGQVIIVNKTNQDIIFPEDLKNKTVGVQSGTTSEEEALKYTNSTLIIGYDNYMMARDDLLAGLIDAIIIDYPAGVGLTKNTDLKIVGDPFTDELYGIALKKGEQALKIKIDTVIASGKPRELENEWFGITD